MMRQVAPTVKLFIAGAVFGAICIIISIVYSTNKKGKEDYESDFRGVIYKFEKTFGGYDRIFVKSGDRCILVTDVYKKVAGYIVLKGDSVIKSPNSNCITYKSHQRTIITICDKDHDLFTLNLNVDCETGKDQ